MHGEIVTSQRNLGPLLLKQSNESHAYPSRPFIAVSHFISFEPLIVPVSMLLPRCRLALDETISSRPCHMLSHGILAVGAGGGPGQPAVDDSLSNYLSAIQGLNSASEVGKNVGKFLSKHQAGGSPLLLNLRPPTARAAVPIQLLVPEFQQLLSAVWTERQEAGMGGGEGTGGLRFRTGSLPVTCVWPCRRPLKTRIFGSRS